MSPFAELYHAERARWIAKRDALIESLRPAVAESLAKQGLDLITKEKQDKHKAYRARYRDKIRQRQAERRKQARANT